MKRRAPSCRLALLVATGLLLGLGALEAQPPFRRGDATVDGQVNLSDAVGILLYLFAGAGELQCQDAADTDDSGDVTITDAIGILNYLFLAGEPPRAPGPEQCGQDATADGLDCTAYQPTVLDRQCEGTGDDPLFSHPQIDWTWRSGTLCLGDLDGDGDGDIISVGSSIVILFRLSGDRWSEPEVLSTTAAARDGVLGDLDADGDLDLATAGAALSVWWNRGNGEYEEGVQRDLGNIAWAISLADLNGDGAGDFVVVIPGDVRLERGEVRVLLNRGDRTFDEALVYESAYEPNDVASGDLDGDGDLDLVVSNEGVSCPLGGCETRPSSLSFLLNRGDGRFDQASETVLEASVKSNSIALADLDGDGRLDLALANVWGGEVRVYSGTGDGRFTESASHVVGNSPRSLTVRDLNSDGAPDIASLLLPLTDTFPVVGRITVSLNDGRGGFHPPATYGTCYNPRAFALGEITEMAPPMPCWLTRLSRFSSGRATEPSLKS